MNPKHHQILQTAGQVLTIESEAIAKLKAGLNDIFCSVVERILSIKGRVIVTGMGKSGHIGYKIAATLASTGTPAFFVHPAEASHGDMGMITPDDLVLAISNSGETTELADLIYYTRRYQIPLVAITSRAKSTLAAAADYGLILPEAPEACPMGLAPTTSTTLTLALGDALAVCLIELRGFSPQDFKALHPGGRLGQQLLRVGDVMHTGNKLPLVSPEQHMGDVLVEITSKGFGCAAVAENGILLGIITDGDLRRHMAPNLLQQTAQTIMTPNPKAVHTHTMLAEALGIMNSKSITALFVVDNQRKIEGLVHIHDCLRLGIK